MRDRILRSFERVPSRGNKPTYIPLYNLPVGTIIEIVTNNEPTPSELDEERTVNGICPEQHVLDLPQGPYTLIVGEWSTVTIDYGGDVTESVRPLHKVLCVGSSFQANVDRPNDDFEQYAITWRLSTFMIESIYLPQAGIRLHMNDGNTDLKRLFVRNKGGKNNVYK